MVQITHISLDWPRGTVIYLEACRSELHSSGRVCVEEATMKSSYPCCSLVRTSSVLYSHNSKIHPQKRRKMHLWGGLKKRKMKGWSVTPYKLFLMMWGIICMGRFPNWISASKNNSGKHRSWNLICLTWSVFKLLTYLEFVLLDVEHLCHWGVVRWTVLFCLLAGWSPFRYF